jgi:hypothetical protein
MKCQRLVSGLLVSVGLVLVSITSACSSLIAPSSCSLLGEYLIETPKSDLSNARDAASLLLENLEERDSSSDIVAVENWVRSESWHLDWSEDAAPSRPYRPIVDYVFARGYKFQIEKQKLVLEACASSNADSNLVTEGAFATYMEKFWNHDEEAAAVFRPCVEKMMEASQESNGDAAEPILAATLDVCDSEEAWKGALDMYPQAFGFDDTTGTEFSLLCSRYPLVGLCVKGKQN